MFDFGSLFVANAHWRMGYVILVLDGPTKVPMNTNLSTFSYKNLDILIEILNWSSRGLCIFYKVNFQLGRMHNKRGFR